MSNKSKSVLLLLLFTWACVSTAATQLRNQVEFYVLEYGQIPPNADPQVAKTYTIFKKVRSAADKNSKRLPKLVVINSQTEPWAIALPDGNIVLSRQAINLCYQLQTNTDACLAFVLGHELAHLANNDFWHQEVYSFLRTHAQSRQLAKFLKQHNSSKAKEIAADDKGFVYAAIAGFPVQNLFPQHAGKDSFFNLWVNQGSSRVVKSYGTTQERAMLLQQRLQEIQNKLAFFYYGVRLSQFDYCDDAVYFLRDFLKVFPGREVMNNLGYCSLQMARQEMDTQRAYLYWMPLLLDIETRANIASRTTQSSIKSLKQAATDNAGGYLDLAVEYLQRAAQADPNYLPAHLNLAVAYLYLGRPHRARAALREALEIEPNNEQLLVLDALAIYEQSEAGLDLWSAAVAKLEKLAASPTASPVVHYNLARLLSMRPRIPQAQQLWNKLTTNNNDLPFPIQAIVCREQNSLPVTTCLGSPIHSVAPTTLWQWPLAQSNFVQVDNAFRQQYLSGWSSVPFDWFQKKLQGNIYRSPDGKAEILELDHFIQMQVIKREIPFDKHTLKQQCPNSLRHHKVQQGMLWSCKQWAVLTKGNVIREAWLIAH